MIVNICCLNIRVFVSVNSRLNTWIMITALIATLVDYKKGTKRAGIRSCLKFPKFIVYDVYMISPKVFIHEPNPVNNKLIEIILNIFNVGTGITNINWIILVYMCNMLQTILLSYFRDITSCRGHTVHNSI